MHQVAAEETIDFIFTSEFHREEGPNWHADTMGKAAIINVGKTRLDSEGTGEPGFRWVSAHGLRLFTCYWSPNSTLQEFKDFIHRLETKIRSDPNEVLLTGDFNAKHTDWGCPKNDKRGEVLIDMINATGLVICNRGKSSTHNKGSIIDLTIATPRTAHKMVKWQVLDRESLSDHLYLLFEIDLGTQTQHEQRRKKIDFGKLETLLTSDRLTITTLSGLDADNSAMALTDAIHECCTVPRNGKKTRRSVHWWCTEIGILRDRANHLRRVFQRKRKKHGPTLSTEEETKAKTAKRDLVHAIKRAKEGLWKKLCDQVQNDPWGLPYKLIKPHRERALSTATLENKSPLALGPDRSTLYDDTETELKVAARSLKMKIAPGPDGITNEAVKCIAALNPGALISVYNTCLVSGVFPKIWKKARLVLIRKGDKPLNSPSSYRPLCLLDCLGKLLEKILDNRLRTFLDDSVGLHERQFGFRKGRSTIDALNKLRESIRPNQKIGILTLDIQNAFNSAPWDVIMKSVHEKEVPAYLKQMLNSYLENRTISFEESGEATEIDVTCGVPQGSVIGPTLWNVLYDGLLRTRLPVGVEYLAFADDVALIARANDSIKLEQLLTSSAQVVHSWLTGVGLALAEHKCEAMILTRTRTHNDMRIIINGHQVPSRNCLKYLGLHIDSKGSFNEHAKMVAARAGRVVQKLSRIMPNISAAQPTKRKLLSNVAHSILLYGSPVWVEDMSAKGWTALGKIQRRICLRVASAYCTTSSDAINVITGIKPLDLLAKDRKKLHDLRRNIETPTTDEDTMVTWQRRWDTSLNGRWTHSIIPEITTWINRTHGETNFHLTQVLSGHGCFAADLKRFGKLESSECWFCGDPVDSAEHTIFACDAWHSRRRRAETTIGTHLTPGNLITTMLKSKANWVTVDGMIQEIMKKKEEEERRRQAVNAQ
ncbi:hypothetical protein QTP88_019645 [Uroleucon formosanum]